VNYTGTSNQIFEKQHQMRSGTALSLHSTLVLRSGSWR
jgi:hypothetical protein